MINTAETKNADTQVAHIEYVTEFKELKLNELGVKKFIIAMCKQGACNGPTHSSNGTS